MIKRLINSFSVLLSVFFVLKLGIKFCFEIGQKYWGIKFTLEQAKNTIPFLDVEIKIKLWINFKCGAPEQTADHVISSCLMHHVP